MSRLRRLGLRLLVPGLYVYLAVDLAVLHLQRRRAQNLGPVWILARLVEGHPVLAYDLVLYAVRHRPATDVAQVLGDLLFAFKHLGGARGGVAVDALHLGVVSVEAHEQVGIEVLDGLAQGLEIEPSRGLVYSHKATPPSLVSTTLLT